MFGFIFAHFASLLTNLTSCPVCLLHWLWPLFVKNCWFPNDKYGRGQHGWLFWTNMAGCQCGSLCSAALCILCFKYVKSGSQMLATTELTQHIFNQLKFLPILCLLKSNKNNLLHVGKENDFDKTNLIVSHDDWPFPVLMRVEEPRWGGCV